MKRLNNGISRARQSPEVHEPIWPQLSAKWREVEGCGGHRGGGSSAPHTVVPNMEVAAVALAVASSSGRPCSAPSNRESSAIGSATANAV